MPVASVYHLEAMVLEALDPNTFRLELPNGHRMVARMAGDMRLKFIRVLPGEKVLVELTPYDLSRGRIIQRQDSKKNA